MTKRQKDYLNKLRSRPLSWSSVASFEFSPETWFKERILDIKSESPEMDFGSKIDRLIQDDPTFLPTLPRYENMQRRIKINFGGIELVGVMDGLNLIKSKELADYKTGKKAWDQKRAKETGQLKFYLLLIYITEKIPPEEFDCFIHWIPTKKEETGDFIKTISFLKDGHFETFKVKHKMQDILKFAQYLKEVYKQMEEFLANHE